MFDAAESRCRKCTVDDLPWILSLAHRRYTKTPDPGTSLSWLVRCLQTPLALVIRSEGAFCTAIIETQAWWPGEPECHIAVLVADKGHHWEAITLLKTTISWARANGCARWYLSSETDFDFEMLARRVGAKPGVMKYRLDL